MSDRPDVGKSAIPGRETFPPAEAQRHATPANVPLGADLREDGTCMFRVWAPVHDRVELHIVAPEERRIPMSRTENGYHEVVVEGCPEGTRYLYVLNGGAGAVERPDPASRHQPEGVHRASEVVGSDFPWHDAGWTGIALEDSVVYELHVGTFTPEGTFDAVIPHLDRLKELGITAVELLPVGQFPGERNWGYDGVYMNAAQTSYGGPRGLKRLVDACHARGLAILLDVVYNHLGPEGNYLSEFGPYFTDRYKTPWGLALNFDGAHSDDVRWFFIHSALQWVDEFHVDGLRVDAVHAIVDHSAEPFLQDLNAAVHARARELGRRVFSIAESDLNDPRVILERESYGLGFDSQWADDYHHSLHVLLTGESDGYYAGFQPKVSELARVIETGYLYVGQHSPYRGRKYGARPRTKNGACFVVSMQNHDQVGNRMLGERITAIASPDRVRLAAAAILLSPFVPMLFMGEEYGEKAPFQYFTSHGDTDLIAAVRKGRLEEFDDFSWEGDPPDPQDVETFERSKLNWKLVERDEHAALWRLYRRLLAIRRHTPALRRLDLGALETMADDEKLVLVMRRWAGEEQALVALNFSDRTQTVPAPAGEWDALIDTGAKIEGERLTLPPHSFAVWAT